MTPDWGIRSQTPVIGSRSALAMVRAPPLFSPSLRLCVGAGEKFTVIDCLVFVIRVTV